MDPLPITATLTVATTDRVVTAELELRNVTSKPAHLLRYNVGLTPELENDVFTITSDAGARAAYLGRLSKRGAPRPEDFVRIEPGQSLTARVRLDGKYELPNDARHEYTIVYSAYHSYPDHAGIWELVSNKARFTFGRAG